MRAADFPPMNNNIWVKTNATYSATNDIGVSIVLKKNLNASKPSEHLPSGGKLSEGLGIHFEISRMRGGVAM